MLSFRRGALTQCQGLEYFDKPIYVVASRASTSAIKAIESNGGKIVCKYYNELALRDCVEGRSDRISAAPTRREDIRTFVNSCWFMRRLNCDRMVQPTQKPGVLGFRNPRSPGRAAVRGEALESAGHVSGSLEAAVFTTQACHCLTYCIPLIYELSTSIGGAEPSRLRLREREGLRDTYLEPASEGVRREPTLPLRDRDRERERDLDGVRETLLLRDLLDVRSSSLSPSIAARRRLFLGAISPFSSRVARFGSRGRMRSQTRSSTSRL